MTTNEKPTDDIDDGCPHGDPDCLGNADECHWACSTFRERDRFLIAHEDGTSIAPSDLDDDERTAVLAAVLAPHDAVAPHSLVAALDALCTDAQALLASSAQDEFFNTELALELLGRLVRLHTQEAM